MDNISAIILGLVQGLTEFLPVSSSGHLVLAEKLLGIKASTELTFEVLLHLSTVLAVIIYFRKRLGRIMAGLFKPSENHNRAELKTAGTIIVATIPAAVAGLLFEKKVELVFNSPQLTALFLICTGVILLFTGVIKRGNNQIGYGSGFVIGIAQAFALLPGISRSGMTISAGLFQKIKPAEAAEFSFLISLPAVIGAIVLKSFKLIATFQTSGLDHYLIGCAAAFVSGYLSIAVLLKIVGKGKFFYFGLYCLMIGLIGIIFI